MIILKFKDFNHYNTTPFHEQNRLALDSNAESASIRHAVMQNRLALDSDTLQLDRLIITIFKTGVT